MKRLTLRNLSLLSFLAACFGQKSSESPKQPTAEYPRFPATDVTGATFERISLDEGFVMKTFFIAPDKQTVYVFAYKEDDDGGPDSPYPVKRSDVRMFALDAKGKI